MRLQSAYDVWHQRIYDADPSHEDASSPWYALVREYIGGIAGLRILEVACGCGGIVAFHDARLFPNGWTSPDYGPVRFVGGHFRQGKAQPWTIVDEVDSPVFFCAGP